MEKLVETIPVRCEDGREMTLSVYQQVIDAASFGNPNATILGLKGIYDEDGKGVNRIDDDNYEIVARGLKATRIK